MLRKGAKSFKPSVRPRPNASRPSASQPAACPNSESQSQAPVPASQLSNHTPISTEDVVDNEASQNKTSQLLNVNPQSQPILRAQAQTSSTTSDNANPAETDSTAKRKIGEDEVQTEQPPSKIRKVTPPSDDVQNSGNSAPSQTISVISTSDATTSDQISRPFQHTASEIQATPVASLIQGSTQSSRVEQESVGDKESPAASHPTTHNATNKSSVPARRTQPLSNSIFGPSSGISRINTTIEKPQNDFSTNAAATTRNIEIQNLESHSSMLTTAGLSTAAPSGPEHVGDALTQPQSVTSEDIDLSGMGAGEASQASHIVPTVTITSEETLTPVNQETPSAAERQRKRAAPRKKRVQVEDDEEPRTEVEIQLNRRRRTPGEKRERRKKPDDGVAKTRKTREGTPEDAEDEVIEPATMKMADLCTDIRIGKKSSRHDELKQRHAQKKIQMQMAQRPELAGLTNNAPGERSAGPRAESAEETSVSRNTGGPVMRVIDGQIVLDDRSLQVDRQRQARDEGLVLEEIEENDYTRVVNSGQYMKRSAAIRWDSSANELFYQGLRQFGTAFEMIAAMFPDRNRRQIKLKFVREERQNAVKVDRALKGKKDEIDFEEYTQLTGQKFENTADIHAEHKRREDEHFAEEERVAAAKAAVDKKKKEDIANAARRGQGGVNDDGDGPESQKENDSAVLIGTGKKKTARSKKANKASMEGGGEEIEILGTI